MISIGIGQIGRADAGGLGLKAIWARFLPVYRYEKGLYVPLLGAEG